MNSIEMSGISDMFGVVNKGRKMFFFFVGLFKGGGGGGVRAGPQRKITFLRTLFLTKRRKEKSSDGH